MLWPTLFLRLSMLLNTATRQRGPHHQRPHRRARGGPALPRAAVLGQVRGRHSPLRFAGPRQGGGRQGLLPVPGPWAPFYYGVDSVDNGTM